MRLLRLEAGHRDRWFRILRSAFNVTLERATLWMDQDGPEHARLMETEQGIVGGLMILPMGQFFGGKRVAMGGIGAVAVAPEARGGGAASQLMKAAVLEMYERGMPLSVLYPATQALYRKAGYERAGLRCDAKLSLAGVGVQDRSLSLRPLDNYPGEVSELYRSWARGVNGAIDREPFIWIRKVRRHEEPVEAYGVGDPLEGYVLYRRTGDIHYSLEITDLVATTPAAARRLFTLLADHRSLAEEVTFPTWPEDPLLSVLPEQRLELKIKNWWMLRLVDVPRALKERGYPVNVSTSFDIELEDEWIPDNRGPWRVEISGGEAQVHTGGQGLLKLHVRGLACLYGGLHTPWQARAAGLLDGPDEELRKLEGVFGPPAAMIDMF